MMLTLVEDNLIYLGGGAARGLLIGTLLGNIANNGLVIKIETGTAKKKTKKK